MATTHALAGIVVASVAALLVPDHATTALLAGAAGGLFPDLDAVVGTHRKTLHFPAYGWVVAVPAVGLAVLVTGPWSVALACFTTAAAFHALSDWAEGGVEWRGWERNTDRAVYCHLTGEWLTAKRWVRYDGAPEDLLCSAVLAGVALLVVSGLTRWLVVGLLAVGTVYTLVRRRVPGVVDRLRART
ncbi:metal-dependent hydrolase [Halomarina salina]|uniref:Metal-dependent hydrolase n=2 Tax=Halomarina salina TaxID=1872699 RepID=A0ABD5RKB0_9EURY|nr:metal-dependent hydrolase [Halomarina salina]